MASAALVPGQHVTRARDGLRVAVEVLYATFAHYGVEHPVPGSPLAVTESDQADLAAAPLRELSADQLGRFSFRAMNTWGGLRHYKHFLPRLCELAAFEPHPAWFVDLTTVCGKLEQGELEDWPELERYAVDAWMDAVWRFAVEAHPSRLGPIDEVVAALARVTDDVRPYLAAWRDRTDAAAVHSLAELVLTTDLLFVRRGRLLVHDRGSVNLRHVARFLVEPETGARLEQAWYDAPDAPFADDVAAAVERLEHWAQIPAVGALR